MIGRNFNHRANLIGFVYKNRPIPSLADLLFYLMILFSSSLYAASYEEGNQAYLNKDYALALKILKPLATQGHSQAQITMGLIYEGGHGVPKDVDEATRWYLMAAKQGEPMVQHFMGVKYFQGQGVEQNYLEAAKWWAMAAKAGIADSQFNLGLMYYRGLGITKDYVKAGELFEAAAIQDHGDAQYSLAVMHAFGQSKEKNYAIAIKWFRKAAEQDMPQAQYNIGVFYENAYGVEKNLNEAKRWYQLAAAQGLQEAADKLQALPNTVAKKPLPEKKVVKPAPATAKIATRTKTPENKASIATVTPTKNNTQVALAPNKLNLTDWFRKQSPKGFTLQLASIVNEKNLIRYLKNSKLGPKAGYLTVVVKGTRRYTAVYGFYDTYQQAEAAVKTLPSHIQKQKPWIRNVGKIQELLR